jgi:hypothetical protein
MAAEAQAELAAERRQQILKLTSGPGDDANVY